MEQYAEEQKKRIRYMYTWMFRRYRTNTLADSGSISDKPVLGPELIPDASRWFNIDNDPYWSRGIGVTISSGVCQFTNTTAWVGALLRNNILTKGKFYKIEFNVPSFTSGIVFAYLGKGDYSFAINSTGTRSIIIQATNTDISFATGSDGTTLQIDNISVREVLINSVTTDYLKMAQNNRMDKSIRFSWLGEAGSKITNGRVEKMYGLPNSVSYPEIVINGNFDADTNNWIGTNANLSVVNGMMKVLSITSNNGYSSQMINLTIGKVYKFKAKISNVTGGVASCALGTSNSNASVYDPLWNASDRELEYIFTATVPTIYINCATSNSLNAYAYFDDISIKETDVINATQTTPTNRPYLCGNIAPNEKLGLKNPNGGSNFMTHPTISFAANEAWSVTICVLDNFKGSSNSLFGNISAGGSVSFRTSDYPGNNVYFIENTTVGSNTTFSNSLSSVGKIAILTLVAENNTFSLYKNGILMSSSSGKNTTFSFNSILLGYGTRYFNGQIKAHIIRAQALAQAQVTAEYTYLRSVYPEIESVDIGVETEKITVQADREFSSDTGWWSRDNINTVIGGGYCTIKTTDGSNARIYKSSILTINRRYRLTYTILANRGGSLKFQDTVLASTVGTYTVIVTATTADLSIGRVGGATDIDIDNISVIELPQTWATSNCEMAATPQGNVIQEMQAAGNVEKITNVADREFSSDTGFWSKSAGIVISNGVCTFNSGDYIYKNSGVLNPVKWLKVTYTISRYVTGTFRYDKDGNLVSLPTAIGTFIYYLYNPTSTGIGFSASSGSNFDVDNISVQEIGWSGSQELYDGIYAQTAEAASAVEKITNAADRDFSSDTGWWSKGANVTIDTVAGVCNFAGGANNYLSRNAGIVTGRYYKMSIKITNYVSGTLIFKAGSGGTYINITGNGTYNYYSLCNSGTYIELQGSSDFIGSVDNLSVKELGLSDATSIANYTYAAVKAAAMWCHYNNSVDNGAIYGKKINWYAGKLMQMDIDYYNAANPSTPWGWRCPTKADYLALRDYLGGNTVAGGKMKVTGTSYWNSPNSGADNNSGFSLIGGGRRLANGTFDALNTIEELFALDNFFYVHATSFPTYLVDDGFSEAQKIWGTSLRFIKA